MPGEALVQGQQPYDGEKFRSRAWRDDLLGRVQSGTRCSEAPISSPWDPAKARAHSPQKACGITFRKGEAGKALETPASACASGQATTF